MKHPIRDVLVLVGLSLALLGVNCASVKQRMYEGGGRDEWQQPERVIETLALQPGLRVADLGSGSGYFTLRLASAVAPDGRVYAVDVDPDINALLEKRLLEEGIGNVAVLLATPEDPGLPEAGVDLLFTSNTFHHLPDPASYFAQVKPALGPGGRVAIIEYDPGKSGWFTRTFGHATTPDEITAALQAAGYRRVASHDFLEQQCFLVFEPAR
jgi:ubiquinone/menaquinone biosynthesis C-methylase UbiE